jgi:hypothetical protein
MSTSPTKPSTPTAPVRKIRTYAEDLMLGRDGHITHEPTETPIITETTSVPAPLPAVTPTPAQDTTTMKGPVLAKHTIASTPATIKSTTKPKPSTAHKVPVPPPAPTTITTSASRDASYDATIITDTKRKRFKLTSEVRSSISDWWQEQVEAYQERKKPKYTVPTAEHRKGVIQQATGVTGRSVTQDHAAVIKRIKAEKEERVAKQGESSLLANTLRGSELAPLPQATPETITWDTPDLPPVPTTSAALVAEIEAAVNEEPVVTVPRTVPKVSSVANAKVERIKPIIPDLPETSSPPEEIEETVETRYDEYDEDQMRSDDENVDEEVEETVAPITPRQVGPSRILPNLPSVAEEKIAVALRTSEPSTETPNPSRASEAVAKRKEVLRQQGTTQTKPKPAWSALVLPLGAMAGFVGITIVVTWYVVWGSQQTDTVLPPPIATTDTTETTITPNTTLAQLITPTTEGRRALLQALAAATTNEKELRQYIPTSPTGVPLLAPALFTIINPTASADFRSNVAAVTIGSYQGQPWIKLRVQNRATALGGMFAWEHSQSADLNPLFGTTIRGDRTVSLSGFRDSSVADLDVRMLETDRGEVRIVYGFINDTTILITTDTTKFTELRAQPF